MADEEPIAGLVQKGGAYPVTEATGDEGGFERTYRVQALPPDTWVMQEDTVKEQFKLDAEAEGEAVDDIEVVSVEPDEPNGVVFVTVRPAAKKAKAADDAPKKAADKK